MAYMCMTIFFCVLYSFHLVTVRVNLWYLVVKLYCEFMLLNDMMICEQ